MGDSGHPQSGARGDLAGLEARPLVQYLRTRVSCTWLYQKTREKILRISCNHEVKIFSARSELSIWVSMPEISAPGAMGADIIFLVPDRE